MYMYSNSHGSGAFPVLREPPTADKRDELTNQISVFWSWHTAYTTAANVDTTLYAVKFTTTNQIGRPWSCDWHWPINSQEILWVPPHAVSRWGSWALSASAPAPSGGQSEPFPFWPSASAYPAVGVGVRGDKGQRVIEVVGVWREREVNTVGC